MKIFVIADPETLLAFSLAGVRGEAVQSPSEVPVILRGLRRDKAALVLITADLAEANRSVIEGILRDSDAPLVLEIPDSRGRDVARDRLTHRIASLARK